MTCGAQGQRSARSSGPAKTAWWSRARVEARTADIQEHNGVDGQEGGDRPEVEARGPRLVRGGAPQHVQGARQAFGAHVDRRHQRQVGREAPANGPRGHGASPALRATPAGPGKGHPEAVPGAHGGARARTAGRLGGVAQDDDPVVVDLDEAALHLEAKLVGTAAPALHVGVDDAQGMGLQRPDVGHVVGEESDVAAGGAAHDHVGLPREEHPARRDQLHLCRGHGGSGPLFQLAGFGLGALGSAHVEERLLGQVVEVPVDQGLERVHGLGNGRVHTFDAR